MRLTWEDNAGKYTIVYDIKGCWRKGNILPVSWECDVNNNVGRSRVPTSTTTLKKDDCDNIYDLFEQLAVKSKELGVNVYQEANGI